MRVKKAKNERDEMLKDFSILQKVSDEKESHLYLCSYITMVSSWSSVALLFVSLEHLHEKTAGSRHGSLFSSAGTLKWIPKGTLP